MTAFRGEADEGRARFIDAPLKFRDRRSDARPTAGRHVAAAGAAGETHHRIVRPLGSDDRADEGEFVRHLRHARQLLADLNAGDVRFDGTELAAVFGGCVGLHVPHVLVRRTARQEDHDDRLVIDPLGRFSTNRLRREDLGQTRATEGEATDLEKGTSRESVAEFARVVTKDGEHDGEGVAVPDHGQLGARKVYTIRSGPERDQNALLRVHAWRE